MDINTNLKTSMHNQVEQKANTATNSNDAISRIESQIDSLEKRKEGIKEEKKEFQAQAKLDNLSSDIVKSKNADFDTQIGNIDTQIAALRAQKQEEMAKKNQPQNDESKKGNEETSSRKKDIPSKNQEVSEANAKNLMEGLSQSSAYLTAAKQIHSSKVQLCDEKNNLQREIETDEGKGVNCSKLREKVSKIEGRIDDTSSLLYINMKKSKEEIDSNNKVNEDKDKDHEQNIENSEFDKKDKNELDTLKNKFIINKYLENTKEKNESKKDNEINKIA